MEATKDIGEHPGLWGTKTIKTGCVYTESSHKSSLGTKASQKEKKNNKTQRSAYICNSDYCGFGKYSCLSISISKIGESHVVPSVQWVLAT